jgi:argininosuccinate lyase
MKMWSGRFRQPLDADFERWQRSFDFDRRLLREELAASHAHAAALKNAGVLTSSELITILQGLKEIGEKAAASPRSWTTAKPRMCITLSKSSWWC